jgi:hypothetical protein
MFPASFLMGVDGQVLIQSVLEPLTQRLDIPLLAFQL